MMRNRIVNYPITLALVAIVAGVVFLTRLYTPNQAIAQPQQTKKITQWEYCFMTGPFSYNTANNWKVTVSYGGPPQMVDSDVTGVAAFNKLGAEGWELVGVSNAAVGPEQTTTTFILKRPKA